MFRERTQPSPEEPPSLPRGRRGRRTSASQALLGLSVGLILGGCGPEDAERAFEPGRVHESVGRAPRWNASSAERFGISAQDFAAPSGHDHPAGLHWNTPETWVDLPAAQFREANFQVAGDERAECYLTTLSGEGGGLVANVNRWRAQLGLAPLGEPEVAALPRQPWLGRSAVRVDFTGTWTGMGGTGSAEGWRLVGLLLVEPQRSRFLKMTGPADLVEVELARFERLAASFHEEEAHGPGDGHDHGPATGAEPVPGHAAPHADATNVSPSGLRWSPPAGWVRGPEKPLREVTYVVEGSECYVTILAGDGGGLLANVNRWYRQMGADPIDEARLAGLERVAVLGEPGVLVELAHPSPGPDDPEALLGLVRMLPEQSLFVKMTGPRALLERQRPAFLEFCRTARGPE